MKKKTFKRIISFMLALLIMNGALVPATAAKAAYYKVTATSEKNVTSNNAVLYGSISYSGTKPSEIGLLLGTTNNISQMKKVCHETPTHNLKSYNVWYNLATESNPKTTLSAGKTYYYCFYVYVNKVYYYSNVRSFTTPCSHSYNDLGKCKNCGASYPLNIIYFTATATATKQSGAMHNSPYGSATITSRLTAGETLTVLGSAVNSFGNTWYLVRRQNSSTQYWVVNDYIKLNQATTTNVAQTYKDAMKLYNQYHGTNYSVLGSGGCVNTAWYQMLALGIVASKDRPAIGATWNGKDFYKNYRNLELSGAKTDTGYSFKTYSGLNGFKQLINEYNGNGKPVYNIVVSFSMAQGSTQFGHVVFIHAIVGNKVYFTDNYTGYFVDDLSVKEGATNVVTVEQFVRFYSTYNGSFNGAIHFYR